jgi:phenylalanyl-tRNA synthetase beta chain
MKISYNWLSQHISINKTPEEIANLLTRSGLEVESVEPFETLKGGLKGLVIGQVLTCEKHPGADKLSKTTVDLGNGLISPIVCGAPNVAAGQKVIVATVGTTLYPAQGEPFKISKAKIRGEVSEGMICAEDEIGLGSSHAGIMVLDTPLPVGTPASEYFKIESDFILEIGLTPNRADAASHLGVARDLKVLLKSEIKKQSIDNFKVDNNSNTVEVIVEDKKDCHRYSGLTISGVKIAESPDWLKNRLKSIGLSPINNIVDITNYILHDLGQPLHAFDLDKIKGKKVVVKTVKAGTEFTTLDNAKRKLSEGDLMICDAEKPMCIAGVFGGIDSGVSAATQNIFLESACFSADSVRKTSMHHGLKTDASFRFERGTDPNITVYALKKAALLIKEIAGGTISSEVVDIYPEAVKNFTIETSYKNIDRLIGLTIDRATIKEILTALEIQITSETESGLTLSVPPYRVDVQREADIVEEIIRIYGYDKIEVSDRLSAGYMADFPEKDKDTIKAIASQLLAANGFNEIITNSLTKPAYSQALNLSDSDVVVLNKLSEDLGVMRQSLLFSGLEVLVHNINRRQKDLKLFEFGKTYQKIEGKYTEKNKLAILLTGNSSSETWQQPSAPVNFYDISSIVTKILNKLGVKDIVVEKTDSILFQQGITCMKDNKIIASIGLIQDKFNKLVDIKQAVFYAELDTDLLIKLHKTGLVYEEISKYPEVRRDLSLVLDKKVSFEEIKKLATQTERKLLRDINVFDVYEGENLGKDKKSYSVSFFLQDFEQTLTDKVIEKTMEKLMASFEKELGAIIRK